ncbi:MAG: hypothetical protein JHD02_00900 [Thermoleophilaceae bacterium]|nr:hypothetical protein [Thermoleophilaceae bacterium]
MSAALDTKSEIVKLARLLDLDEDELEYLKPVAPATLRELRAKVTDVVFGVGAGGISRLAAHSDLVPPQLIAAITREAVGPFLTARVAGLVEPRLAVKVVKRLSPEFLTEVAIAMDPRRAHDVIGAMPPEVVLDVAKNLADRGEWIVMGSFAGHLDPATASATFSAVTDEGLLKTAFVMEDKSQLGQQLSMVDDERLDGILLVAAEDDLWPEALDLLINLRGHQRQRVIDAVVQQEPLVIDSLIESLYEHDLWPSVFDVVVEATDHAAVADAVLRARAPVFRALIDAVNEHAMWKTLRQFLDDDVGARRNQFFKRAGKLKLLEKLGPVSDMIEVA